MSYDLEIWSAEKPDLSTALPADGAWSDHGEGRALCGRAWQIICDPAIPVDADNVPHEVNGALPGIAYLTELSLEPGHAPASAKKRLLTIAKQLAKAWHGVVQDRQTGEVSLPRGVKPYRAEKREGRFGILTLSWWFLGDVLDDVSKIRELLTAIDAIAPDAIPHRFGLFEPPAYLVDEQGIDGLAHFLWDHQDELTVLYSKRPFFGMSLSPRSEPTSGNRGFLSGHFSIECEASAIRQPGWQAVLRRVWYAVSAVLQPFYAEARTLKGYMGSGATYSVDMRTQEHPVRMSAWRGVPPRLGHAAAFGARYAAHWPDLISSGLKHGELVVLDTGDWSERSTLSLRPPASIAQPGLPAWKKSGRAWRMEWVEDYPEVWPFD